MVHHVRGYLILGFGLVLVITTLPVAAQTPTPAPPPSWEALQFPPLPAFQPPRPRTFRLRNGIPVYMLPDPTVPVVRLVGWMDVGEIHAPRPGIAGLTGTLLRTGGTRLHTPDELDALLDARAIELEIQIGRTSGQITLAMLSEQMRTGLAILGEVLTEPRWDPDRLEVAKRQEIAFLMRENDDPEAIVAREFQKIVFGADHPYGRYPTPADIRAITVDDIRTFYEQHIRPDRLIIGVWGRFNERDLRNELRQYLGNWRRPRTERARPGLPVTRPGIYLVRKPDVTQTKIRFGYAVPPFNPKQPYARDIYALQVANVIFGRGFASRLFVRIRTQMGLAYYAYSRYPVSFQHPGAFVIATATQAQRTVQAIRAIQDELERIRTEGVTDAEVQYAKNWLINSFIFEYETPANIVLNYLELAAAGLPEDYLEQFVPNVQAVTTDDVNRVIRQYWHPERMALLVVGTPEKFDSPLSVLGEVHEIPLHGMQSSGGP